MKALDMAKENNFLLREAAKAAQMGYYDHLAASGKGDPAEERWIEALTAGADAITQVSVLESRLAQAERERDVMKPIFIREMKKYGCTTCEHHIPAVYTQECLGCGNLALKNWQWNGVCPENMKEETT